MATPADRRAADDIGWTGEIHAPVDRTILIRLRSSDVIHSLFVPSLRVKQDVVPGMTPEVLIFPMVLPPLTGNSPT